MKFNETSEFVKDFKHLAKKYRSLPNDLEELKRVITAIPFGNSKHFNVITRDERCAVIKARLFCRYLKGSSLRIIYAYHCQVDKIDFIEIYAKGEKINENMVRIKEYFKKDNYLS